MADEHRRVEPRPTIGTGMAADPERIEHLRHDWERAERTWRTAPSKNFSQVLIDAPTSDADRYDGHPDKKSPSPPPKTESDSTGDAADTEAVEESMESMPHSVAPPLPRVQPDPRMRALHAHFEVSSSSYSAVAQRGTDAPPNTARDAIVSSEESPASRAPQPSRPQSATRPKAPKRLRG